LAFLYKFDCDAQVLLIYDERKEKIKLALEGKKYISKYARKFGYSGAKDAVLGFPPNWYSYILSIFTIIWHLS